jgi:hypothetical protein
VQFVKSDIKKPSLIKSVIEESKRLRAERGEDFYSEKKHVATEYLFVGKNNNRNAKKRTSYKK